MNNLHKTQDSNNPIPNTNTNNTKSKKSYFFVILSVFIIFCILSFVGYEFIKYKQQNELYNTALSLKNEKQFASAEDLFLSLGDFKDSQEQIDLIKEDYITDFAKTAGSIYGTGISSWVLGSPYGKIFIQCDYTTSILAVSRMKNEEMIKNEMARIENLISDNEKALSALKNPPSAYKGCYELLLNILDNDKNIYELAKNPISYYDTYTSEYFTRYDKLDESFNSLTEHMKNCDNSSIFNKLSRSYCADIIAQSDIKDTEIN